LAEIHAVLAGIWVVEVAFMLVSGVHCIVFRFQHLYYSQLLTPPPPSVL